MQHIAEDINCTRTWSHWSLLYFCQMLLKSPPTTVGTWLGNSPWPCRKRAMLLHSSAACATLTSGNSLQHLHIHDTNNDTAASSCLSCCTAARPEPPSDLTQLALT
jgi:hypothetical protein